MMRAGRSRCCRTRRSATQFVTTLQTIAKAGRRRLRPPAPAPAAATAPEPAAPPPAPASDGPIAPNSLGAEVLASASAFLSRMSNEVAARSARSAVCPSCGLAGGDGDRSRAARRPAGRGVAPGPGVLAAASRSEWAVRRADPAPDPGAGPPGAEWPPPPEEERRGARRAWRDRAAAPPPDRGADPAAPRAAGARAPRAGTAAGAGFLAVGHLVTAAGLGGEDPAAPRPAGGDRRLRAVRAILSVARDDVLAEAARACACCTVPDASRRLRHALDPADRCG